MLGIENLKCIGTGHLLGHTSGSGHSGLGQYLPYS